MVRCIASVLCCVTSFGLFVPTASAVDLSLHVGAGPRFSTNGMDAVGALHVNVEVYDMLHLSVDLNSYFGGASPVDFAGGDVGLLFQPPIPGPIDVQVGLLGSFTKLHTARHGSDKWLGGLTAEGAVAATFGVFQARVAYQHVLTGSPGHGDAFRNQFMIMLGASL